MKQPWLYRNIVDLGFIVLPPFFVLALVFVFHSDLQTIQDSYSFVTWLFLIVFIDVAHVYSTLFKTYFIKDMFQRHRRLYTVVPLLSLGLALILYQIGSLFLWSVLALIAVFHFVRQQYGFMRLYSRYEIIGWSRFIDQLAIYAATIYPMLYWVSTPRSFNWFLEGEFEWLSGIEVFLPILSALYFIILTVWFLKTSVLSIRNKYFNIPKNLIILGTILSWYFGIVYFNNDLIFTLLNVISHGIPYMALIFIQEIKQKDHLAFQSFRKKLGISLFIFVAVVVGFAFSEEVLWESLVWKEHFSFLDYEPSELFLSIMVPVLIVPQLTHYILDGFIWKRTHK